MKIYKLQPIEPTIIGYPFALSQEEMQGYVNFYRDHIGRGESALEHWQPTILCDLYQVDIGRLLIGGKTSWVFNEKARNALAPLIGEYAEYLPYLHKEKLVERFTKRQRFLRKKTIEVVSKAIHEDQQYLVNFFKTFPTDVIDKDVSVFDYFEDEDIIYGIENLAFIKEKIKDAHVFEIDNAGIYFQNTHFVSDDFKKIVEENGLIGLKFIDDAENEGNLVWSSDALVQ